jgi:hypothetical protein
VARAIGGDPVLTAVRIDRPRRGVRGAAPRTPPEIPKPSRADIQRTQAIIEVAKPLGIAVNDHIIVGRQGHASFKGLRLI